MEEKAPAYTRNSRAIAKSEKHIRELIDQAQAIESISALDAGTIGYNTPCFILASLPHSDPKTDSYTRVNDKVSVTIQGDPDFGIPYGVFPRLILCKWMTELVRKPDTNTITLENTLSGFLRSFGQEVTGGPRGTIKQVKDQLRRLSGCRFIIKDYTTQTKNAEENSEEFFLRSKLISPVEESFICWLTPIKVLPTQGSLFKSFVRFSEEFAKRVREKPVPGDERALNALKGSSMALDLYWIITYLMYCIQGQQEPVCIPWPILHGWIGSTYKRLADLRQKISKHLPEVLTIYPKAQVNITKEGLKLISSLPHVPPKVMHNLAKK
jgi:hypothetical protein